MASNWKNFKRVASFLGAIALTQFWSPHTCVRAADTLVLRFGPFTESISLEELQNTADTGEFPRGLELYTSRISEEQRRFFVRLLRTKVPIDVVTVNSLLNTQMGVTILNQLSQAVVRKDDAGVQALRAALVLGTTHPQGLSLINFIAAYPSQRLEIDVLQAFYLANQLPKLRQIPQAIKLRDQVVQSPLNW